MPEIFRRKADLAPAQLCGKNREQSAQDRPARLSITRTRPLSGRAIAQKLARLAPAAVNLASHWTTDSPCRHRRMFVAHPHALACSEHYVDESSTLWEQQRHKNDSKVIGGGFSGPFSPTASTQRSPATDFGADIVPNRLFSLRRDRQERRSAKPSRRIWRSETPSTMSANNCRFSAKMFATRSSTVLEQR